MKETNKFYFLLQCRILPFVGMVNEGFKCLDLSPRRMELWFSCCVSDPMDCSPPDSSVCGILRARIWEWVAMAASCSLLRFLSVELVTPSSHLTLCCPLLLLPSVFLSIRVFSNQSAPHHPVAKNWNFSFRISHSNEDSGLNSLRLDWFDLQAVRSTLWSLLQHYNSKASILWCSALFMAQVSHLYYWQGWGHECKVQGSETFQVGTKDRGLYNQAKEVTLQKNALK